MLRPDLNLGRDAFTLYAAYKRPDDAQAESARIVRQYLACACAVMAQGDTDTNPMFRVLRDGTAYASAALTDDEITRLHAALDRARIRFPPKQCFCNAQRFWQYANHHDALPLAYVEGWATTEMGVPIHHAWLSLHGKVIDLTLRTRGAQPTHRGRRLRDRVLGIIPKGWGYVGIEIPWPTVMQRIIDTREWGSMFYRW